MRCWKRYLTLSESSPLNLKFINPTELPDALPARIAKRLTAKDPARVVLVVDDDQMNAAALRIILTRRGCEVKVAFTLADALALIDEVPNIVLLDLMLPDGDGAVILSRMRGNGQPGRVVVMTAVTDPERLSATCHLKPDALLQKPFELRDLMRALER